MPIVIYNSNRYLIKCIQGSGARVKCFQGLAQESSRLMHSCFIEWLHCRQSIFQFISLAQMQSSNINLRSVGASFFVFIIFLLR